MARNKLVPLTLALAFALGVAPHADSGASEERFRVGERFPDIALAAVDGGKPLSIRDYRGGRVVLHVFATWSIACRAHVPVWHAATAELARAGRLRVLGIAEEQHADRVQLFMQWNRMDWRAFADPYGLLEAPGVPITLLIDEYGVIRRVVTRPEGAKAELTTFLAATYTSPGPETEPPRVKRGQLERAARGGAAGDLRAYATALAVNGAPDRLDRAIEIFARATAADPDHAATWFRTGVAHRARYDSARREHDDFARAVQAWSRAHEIDPENPLWRARLEQYGPRSSKPYPSYDWVERARADLARIGDPPVYLVAEPTVAELARPSTRFDPAPTGVEPDPDGRIERDPGRLVVLSSAVVAVGRRPGGSARVHLEFVPNGAHRTGWDRATDPPLVWLSAPAGWEIEVQKLVTEAPAGLAANAPRRVEVDLRRTAETAPAGTLVGYALYHVCAGRQGCVARRQDLSLSLPDLPPAPQ